MGSRTAFAVCILFLATTVSWAASQPKGGRAGVAAVTVVGAGVAGQHAFEFTGRIDQNGAALASFGYLTHLQGLSNTRVAPDPLSTSEATGRFTYYGTSTVTARAVNGPIFTLTSSGTVTIYYHPAGGATFSNSASFKQGRAIAAFRLRQQSIVNVFAPNQGILTVMGEAVQTKAGTFKLQSKQYRLGRIGLRESMLMTGQGTRTQTLPPVASFQVAGADVVLAG